MRELILKKCNNCNALIKVINDCNCRCGIECCDEEMETLTSNTSDGSQEKHKPIVTVKNDKIIVEVNHVMESEHLIEWICLVSDTFEKFIYLTINDTPKIEFDYVKGATIYSYCNKHGLWKTKVE